VEVGPHDDFQARAAAAVAAASAAALARKAFFASADVGSYSPLKKPSFGSGSLRRDSSFRPVSIACCMCRGRSRSEAEAQTMRFLLYTYSHFLASEVFFEGFLLGCPMAQSRSNNKKSKRLVFRLWGTIIALEVLDWFIPAKYLSLGWHPPPRGGAPTQMLAEHRLLRITLRIGMIIFGIFAVDVISFLS
jgi:hypothetical protein